jgi:hypothetical protein
MYKAAARMLIRRNIRLLNEGRYEPALAMFAHDAELTFPVQNTWSIVRVVWGKIRSQEHYEDTERVSSLDDRVASSAARGPA